MNWENFLSDLIIDSIFNACEDGLCRCDTEEQFKTRLEALEKAYQNPKTLRYLKESLIRGFDYVHFFDEYVDYSEC